MPFMDRDSFIALLNSFGDPDDEKVLANARTVHARMVDAGVSWDSLLVPAPGSTIDVVEDDTLAPDTDDLAEEGAAPGSYDEDASLIDHMLGEYALSDDTRRELMDLKADITAGEFTRQDSRYIRNLANRLAHKRKAG